MGRPKALCSGFRRDINRTSAGQKHSSKKQVSQNGDKALVKKRNKNISYLAYLGYHGPISWKVRGGTESVAFIDTGNGAHFLSPPQDHFTSTVVMGQA